MPDDPYRPPPAISEADAELARLAGEGEHKILAESERRAAAERSKPEKYLLQALGGEPLWKAPEKPDPSTFDSPIPSPPTHGKAYLVAAGASLVVAMGAGAAWLFGPAGSDDMVQVEQLVGALGAAIAVSMFFVGQLARNQELGREPKVEAEAAPVAVERPNLVEAERAWLASLPVAIDGYFEALSAEPDSECNLLVELRFYPDRPPPDERTMVALLGLIDTDASIQRVSVVSQGGEGVLVFRSGSISGETATRVNGVFVYSNQAIARYFHALADRVLLPLHRSHPLTHVALSR
jgi:hypothetical protein